MITRPITEGCSNGTCLDLRNRISGRSSGRHLKEVLDMAATANAAERRDALVERLFMDAISAFDLLSVYLGDVLGLYRTLADKGPLTSPELAEAAGIHERYAREWLEQQAASGLLELEPNGDARRYRLPEGHDEALLESSSLSYIAPPARSFAGAVKPLQELLAAFRRGEGVPVAGSR